MKMFVSGNDDTSLAVVSFSKKRKIVWISFTTSSLPELLTS